MKEDCERLGFSCWICVAGDGNYFWPQNEFLLPVMSTATPGAHQAHFLVLLNTALSLEGSSINEHLLFSLVFRSFCWVINGIP